ncbi:6556_t:CDS:2 [Funneliformis geosporum]|uniref:RBR-type E3 ubiquitin transferase n=1 Tax=Funneliformis geosporum TaxID=1117311 RepID=A0A9W4SFN6_9GLOM|nr:6556_t:CDS:2 [Funneliformis geosporum]CAI2167729.1 12819_t:CDS:2 [Funneliformis geosporum]
MLYSTEDCQECQIKQENEILALEAIYPQDFTYTENHGNSPRYQGSLTIRISTPHEIMIYFTGGKNSTNDLPLKVRYLPPVKIIFSMPSDYPIEESLHFELECCWMRCEWIRLLEEELLKIWEEERDAAKNQDFINDHFTCGICLEEKHGDKCYRINSCQHVFCQICLREYFEILIREGSVIQVKCPDLGCKLQNKLTKEEMSEIVGPEMSQRYVDLLEKQKLETDPLVTYCPRKVCQAPVKKDSSVEKLCVCTKCTFAFCWFCQRTWHGVGVPCAISNIKKVVQEYMAADEATKSMFELRYGTKNIEKLVKDAQEEMETDKWKKSNTQKCPQCEAAIEKSMGCNHMLCTRCQTHFCYLCGNWVDPKEPYRHFNNVNTSCNQRLFDGVNVDDFELADDFILV